MCSTVLPRYIAENKLSWLEGQQMQTNFYITPEFAKTVVEQGSREELLELGGRYAALERAQLH